MLRSIQAPQVTWNSVFPGSEQNVLKQLLIPRSATVERVRHPEKNLRSTKTVSSFKSGFVTLLFTAAFQKSTIICLLWFLLYLNTFHIFFSRLLHIHKNSNDVYRVAASRERAALETHLPTSSICLPSHTHVWEHEHLFPSSFHGYKIFAANRQQLSGSWDIGYLKSCRFVLSFSPSRLQPLIQMPSC